jgi:hypothetical protein
MDDEAHLILQLLQSVELERTRRNSDADLAGRVLAVKSYQHSRFAATYQDMLQSGPTRRAALFFLNELYGPKDFSDRDQQFVRVVPSIVRVLPKTLVSTVLTLARLHALSEELDTAMGMAAGAAFLRDDDYGVIWRAVGRAEDRSRQIDWMLEIGLSIQAHSRKSWVRTSLRLMRGPANAAGFGALQSFLEEGLESFSALPDAKVFLGTIAARERALAQRLFAGS